MRRAVLAGFAAAILALSASIASAQQQFEAATIKPSHPQPGSGALTNFGAPGGQFRMTNMPLNRWVEMGLTVPDYALKAPTWLNTSVFDLEARLPNQPLDQKARAEMVKALLIRRFGLKWHEEQASVSGYELVPDKKVLIQPLGLLDRLRPHGSSSGSTMISNGAMSMAELAAALGNVLGKPVVDSTHLSGVYEIKLMWRPMDEAALAQQRQYGKQYGIDVDNLPSTVFSAVQEKLGLRLQSAKVPSKVIVVDNINRQPTEN